MRNEAKTKSKSRKRAAAITSSAQPNNGAAEAKTTTVRRPNSDEFDLSGWGPDAAAFFGGLHNRIESGEAKGISPSMLTWYLIRELQRNLDRQNLDFFWSFSTKGFYERMKIR